VNAGIATILTIAIANAGIIYFFFSSIAITIITTDRLINMIGVNIFFLYLALVSG